MLNPPPQPQELRSFKIHDSKNQYGYGCSYTVRIKVSCSSSQLTRDAINLAFSDDYRNEIYAPWLDDPSLRAFERCSTDTFKLTGPCGYGVCSVYLHRQGWDGWTSEWDMRVGPINPKDTPPAHSGGLNMVMGSAGPNSCNLAAFPNAAPLRPSPRTSGQADFSHISTVDAYCQQHEVSAMGDNVPAPFMTFEATGFPPEILREMHLAGFLSPTPIQAQTWPVALQNRDIVAIAKTGSGKTLGYLIPAFIHLQRCHNNPQLGPTVLVLAPTRELATQIQDEAIKFGRSSRFSCTCLYGGAPKDPQLKEIERGADIIVATPGRLNDILEMKKINFRQVSFLVLDEADRMLDMGFEPQIRKIVNEIPPRRQTLMYTATWPKEVRKIAGDLLVNPVQVNIGNVNELAANKSITQYVEVVAPMDKQRRLEQIIRAQERGSKIIIFCSTKRLCDHLAYSIGRAFGAAAIHGDKSQGERDHVLNQFRSGKAPILVATDVAARGLDIKDIRVVINYDFPTGIEDYVHRIGRTGRAGATGVAYTFFSDQDWKYAADLVKVLEGANQFVPPEVQEMATRGGPVFPRSHGGISRWDSGGGRWEFGGGRGMRDGGGRWESGGGRGMRDGGGGGHDARDLLIPPAVSPSRQRILVPPNPSLSKWVCGICSKGSAHLIYLDFIGDLMEFLKKACWLHWPL